jgi:aspartate racemase
MTSNVVGVLGGMGPLATVDFMRKVVQATPAERDQEHVPMVVSCLPQIPDRAAAFRGTGASPLPAMLDSGRRLLAAGAGILVMPCNTAHLWFEPVQQALGVPMLHLVDAALADAEAAARCGAGIALLATDATLASGLYLARRGASTPWLLPTAVELRDRVMPGIAAVKAGRLDEGRAHLTHAAQALRGRGAGALVLGCTEIPLVLDAEAAGVPIVDATAALAREVVAWSLRRRPGAEPR